MMGSEAEEPQSSTHQQEVTMMGKRGDDDGAAAAALEGDDEELLPFDVEAGEGTTTETTPGSAKLKASGTHQPSGKDNNNTREHFDLATGRLSRRYQRVRLLEGDEAARNEIAKSVWQKRFGLSSKNLAMSDQQQQEPKDVYRIESVAPKPKLRWRLLRYLVRPMSYSSSASAFLRWSFDASFAEVTLAFVIWFTALIVFFAAIIYLIMWNQFHCFNLSSNDHFMDALHLSWTTLSTVGYGAVYPSVPVENNQVARDRCVGANAFMAFEAFVGILFGGMVGAVLFAKIARIQSIAQVQFSYPICVRYGTGVSLPDTAGDGGAENKSDDDDDDVLNENEIPCPVLEFRLANVLSGKDGCEIVDARVSVVATSRADKEGFGSDLLKKKHSSTAMRLPAKAGKTAFQTVQRAGYASATAAKTAKKVGSAALFGVHRSATQATGNMIQRINYALSRTPDTTESLGRLLATVDEHVEADPYNEKQKAQEALLEQVYEARFVEKLALAQEEAVLTLNSVVVDEGNSKLCPTRVFHRLETETDSHPFFNRVWTIRHELDASSPLLSDVARRMIDENNGYWPKELNHYEQVREHLHFNEIIVTLSGTSNACGSAVFAQKVYDYCDVNIGYKFAKILRVSNQRLVADIALLNDVTEQDGGGREPFSEAGRDGENNNIARVVVEATGDIVEATGEQVGKAVDATLVAGGIVLGKAVELTTQSGEVIADASEKSTESATGEAAKVSSAVEDQTGKLIDKIL